MAANPNAKGYSGEAQIVDILRAPGYEAQRTGQFKKLDVSWLFRGLKRFLEVKRKKRGWTQIYQAFSEDAWFVGRADYEQWFIAMPLIEYLRQNSNTGLHTSPSPKAGTVIEALTPLTTDTSQHGS